MYIHTHTHAHAKYKYLAADYMCAYTYIRSDADTDVDIQIGKDVDIDTVSCSTVSRHCPSQPSHTRNRCRQGWSKSYGARAPDIRRYLAETALTVYVSLLSVGTSII